VRIEIGEVIRRVARAKVLAPATEHRIEIRDDPAQVLVTPGSWSEGSHALAHPTQGTLRGPSLEVVDALPRPLPNGPAHALAQVTPEKVETFPPAREVDQSRLLGMQLEPEPREHVPDATASFLDLRLRVTHHHEVIGIADQRAQVRTLASHTRSRTC